VKSRLATRAIAPCLVSAILGSCDRSRDEQSGSATADTTSTDRPPPHQERSVRFRQAHDGFDLAGTLILPAGDGPHASVVLVTGSGSQDRDETIGSQQPFRVLADGLARAGIAVLRFDDRGTGESEGRPVEHSDATTLDLADDTRAAVDFLATQSDIAPDRIGIIGHSEGALIATIVANQTDPAFVVLLAGSAVPGAEILRRQTADTARAEGAPADIVDWQVDFVKDLIDVSLTHNDRADAQAAMRQVLETAATVAPAGALPDDPATAIEQIVDTYSSPWMRYFIAYDPAPALQDLDAPVLALFGGLDVQVAAVVNEPATRAALDDNPDATVRVLEDLNHLFQRATTGALSEYENLTPPVPAPAISIIADWIHETTDDPPDSNN
jgi:pimeloyl-ACP methyl ester carboxylesterase